MGREPKRRRLETRNGGSSAEASAPMWLDRLPIEVSRSVVSLLIDHASHPEEALLALAKSSSRHTTLVREAAVEGRLSCEASTFRQWDQVVGRDVSEVKLPVDGMTDKDAAWYAQVLVRPNVTRVVLDGDERALMAVRNAPNLQALRVVPRANQVNLDVLLITLKCASVRELSLVCTTCEDTEDCLVERLVELSPPILEACLKTDCSKVVKAEIFCECYEEENQWSVIRRLPALQEVTLWGNLDYLADVEGRGVERLQQMEVVNVRNCSTWNARLIGRIGKSVAAVRFDDFEYLTDASNLTEEEVRDMSPCVALKEFEGRLERGAEGPLMSICENLRVLRLKWEYGPYDGPIANYRAPAGWMLGLVRKARFLERLELYNLTLSRDEMQNVLKELGSRLQVFGFSDCGHCEGSLSRTEFMMRNLAICNTQLRCLRLYKEGDDASKEPGDHSVSHDCWFRVLATVDVLWRRTKISSAVHRQLRRRFDRGPWFDS